MNYLEQIIMVILEINFYNLKRAIQINYMEITIFNENLVFSLLGYKSSIYEQIEYKNNKYVNNFSQTDLNQSGIDVEINFLKENKILFYSSFQSSKKVDRSDQLRRPEKVYGLNLNRKFKNNLLVNFN